MPRKNEKELIKKVVPDKAVVISPVPNTNQGYIHEMGKKLACGDFTVDEIGRELQLTANQVKFCKEYIKFENFGHGTNAALIAYGYDPANKSQRQIAANIASECLKPTHPVYKLIQIMLDSDGFNQSEMDKQLLFVAQQNVDLKAKTQAIVHANTLFGRNKKIVEHNVNIVKLDYSALSEKDLRKLIEIGRKAKVIEDKNPENV